MTTNSLNRQMAERFGRWLDAQKYSSSTKERYCRIARHPCVMPSGPLEKVCQMFSGMI
jgi:hypothetical protein